MNNINPCNAIDLQGVKKQKQPPKKKNTAGTNSAINTHNLRKQVFSEILQEHKTPRFSQRGTLPEVL